MKVDHYLITEVINIGERAGDLTMQYYNTPTYNIERKDDNSPVTCADIEVSKLISKSLIEINKNIPIITEENSYNENLSILQENKNFWLVDPIDGTWSFIKKNGAFTVNIALVKNGKSLLGIIHCPLDGTTYYNVPGEGAFKKKKEKIKKIKPKKINANGYDFLVSSQNLNQQTTDFLNGHNVSTITPIPSSIKLCLLGEGRGDIYPRFKPTYIWDTAAGHAILSEVGGEIFQLDGNVLRYDQALKNPNFIAISEKSFFSKL